MSDYDVTRRNFGKLSALAAATVIFSPMGRAAAVTRDPELMSNFPEGIKLTQAVFSNWDNTIVTGKMWTAVPGSEDDVLALANWAAASGVNLRPFGYQHSWSPVATVGRPHPRTVLVDVRELAGVTATTDSTVTAWCGTRMDDLLERIHGVGRTLLSVPAPGDITVVGAVAVNGHGTGLSTVDEPHTDGRTLSTMSNLITQLRFLEWDHDTETYRATTVNRDDPRCAALLTCLGSCFIISVTLQTAPDVNVHCINRTDIDIDDILAAPEDAGENSLTSLLEVNGRVGFIWYCFTRTPWVQIWRRADQRPTGARRVTGPYNYPFADTLPDVAADTLEKIVSGQDRLAPAFGSFMLSATKAGLTATGARNMWGPNKCFVHFVRPTTLKVAASSIGAVVPRSELQRVAHNFSAVYTSLLDSYRGQRKYPINGVVELRVSEVDDPSHSVVAGAVASSLSGASRVPGSPEKDTVIWLDVLTLPGTPHADEFYAELEETLRSRIGGYATLRGEWAKRWAHTPAGPWTNSSLSDLYVDSLPDARDAVAELRGNDPKGVFASPFVNTLFP